MILRLRELWARHRTLWILLAAAFLIRLVYLVQYSALPDWTSLSVDNWYHLHWAQSIAEGNLAGDTTYFRAPFYVYCLAALWWLFGLYLWAARVFGILVGVLSVGLTYVISARLFGQRAGLISAALHAIYPVAIYFDGELLLDPLFTLLLQIALLRFVVWLDSGRARDLLWLGLALGLAAITRPTAFAVLPVIGLAVTWRHRGSLALLKGLALLCAGMAVMVGPVFLRNLIVAHDPVLIASQGGINWYIGNNAEADGVSALLPEPYGFNWRIADITFEAERAAGHTLTPGEVSAYWTARGTAWIRDHPLSALELYGRKLYFFWGPLELSNNRDIGAFFRRIPWLHLIPLSFSLILTMAIVGTGLTIRSDGRVRWMVAILASFSALSALYFVNSRFRLPIVPLLLCLAGPAVCSLVGSLFADRWRFLRQLTIVAGLGAVAAWPWLSLRPGVNVQDMTSLALHLYHRGDYDAALDENRRALALDSSFADLNLNIGVCHLRLGQTDSARYYFTRETRLHPLRARAFTNLASLDLLGMNLPAARTEISRALTLQPYDLTANLLFLRIAAADSSISDSELVVATQNAIERTDQPLAVLTEGAVILLRRQNLVYAEQLATRALHSRPPPIETDDAAFNESFPNDRAGVARQKARSQFLLGSISGQRGLLAQAIRYSRQAIEGDSTLAEAYVNLALAYRSTGDTAMANEIRLLARQRFAPEPDSSRPQ